MPSENFTATVLTLSAAVFATLLGLGMMVPALPVLQGQLGLSDVLAGAMLSCFGFARMLCNAPSGYAVDRWGVLPVAGFGLLLLAAGGLAGGAFHSYGGSVASFVLQGAGAAAFASAALTTLLLSAGPAHRGRAMSWFQAAVLLSFAAGPVIGGLTIGPFGPNAPFWVTLGLTLLIVPTLGVMRRLLPRRVPVAETSARPPTRATALIRRALVIAALVGFTAFFSRVGFAWYVLPHAAHSVFSLDAKTVGFIIGAGTAANLVIMPLIGIGIDRIGARPVLIGATAVSVLGLALPVLMPTVTGLWVATAITMVGTGTMIPAASALALTGSRPEETGRIMGLFRTISDLGMALGPLLIPAVAAGLMLTGETDTLVPAVVTAIGLLLALVPLTRARGAGRVAA